jgi:hypothetical protein
MARQTQTTQTTSDADRPVTTAGEVFPDGTLLEVIRDPADSGQITLLRWDGDRAEVANRIECMGRNYTPVKLSASAVQAINFPSQPENHGSTADLFAKLVGVIRDFFDFPDRDLRLVAYWVLSTWFVDMLPMA